MAGASTPLARADDRVDTTLTWFQEQRSASDSLTVVHPQLDVGFDVGDHLAIGLGYQADIVSGATESIYAAPPPGVDAISTATLFSDTRHAGNANLALQGRRSSLALGYGYATERDYLSHSVSGTASVDLPGKNTTFAVSYIHNFDSVCDFDNGDASPLERQSLRTEHKCFDSATNATTITHALSIDTAQATVTQNLSPTAAVQLGVYGQILDGFQSNPYRRVRGAGCDAQETTPRVRARSAAWARINLAIPPLHSAITFHVRGYMDTWAVKSGTAEILYSQYLGTSLLFRLRGRAYQQSSAFFFRDAFDYDTLGPAGAYFTGDRELSPLRTFLFGARLSYLAAGKDGRSLFGIFDTIDLHLNAEGLYTTPLTTLPPGGDVTGIVPDAIIAQVGLLMRY